MSDIAKMTGGYRKGTIGADGEAIIDMNKAPLPATVWVVPNGSDTVAVSYSLDGGVTYKPWANGPVTAVSTDTEKELVFYSGITHLKFERTDGDGTHSSYGVS